MIHGIGGRSRAWCLLSVLLCAASPADAQQRALVERVDVSRVILDVRVVDDRGRPMLGLTAADFEVSIGGRPVRVESASWTGTAPAGDAAFSSVGITGYLQPESRGQLIIFIVQKSLEGDRARGLLRLLQDSGRLLAQVNTEDRIAVLSFDSHLKIWSDFTADLDLVEKILADDVMFGRPPNLRAQGEPSLLAALSQQNGRETYTIEDALAKLGTALAPFPGAKSVVLIGYGFGEFTMSLGMVGSRLDQRYEDARVALEGARASVFCLDVTQADYHTFEHGLEVVAEDTGGFLARTHLYARRAIERVANAMVGHYVLFTEKPTVEPGRHAIDIDLVGSKGTVLARSSYVE